MKVKMLHDKLLIKRVEVEQKTQGGIILSSEPEGERETIFGQVVSVGPGKQVDGTGIIPTVCKEGNIISCMGRIPRRIVYMGEEFHILRESDVDAIFEDRDIEIKRYEASSTEQNAKVLN